MWSYDFKLYFDVIKQDMLKKKVFTNVKPTHDYKKQTDFTHTLIRTQEQFVGAVLTLGGDCSTQ